MGTHLSVEPVGDSGKNESHNKCSKHQIFRSPKLYPAVQSMKIETLHIGQKVRHPQYGVGVVKAITEQTADILFEDARRTVSPEGAGVEAAEARAALSGLDIPLRQLVDQVVEGTISKLGLEKPDAKINLLGQRWHTGRLVMHPSDPALQTKEVPLEVFFHKIVGMRNQLRVLEQKINSHEKLSDAEKIEMQQYITRCQGSMTTFNILFRDKEDQF